MKCQFEHTLDEHLAIVNDRLEDLPLDDWSQGSPAYGMLLGLMSAMAAQTGPVNLLFLVESVLFEGNEYMKEQMVLHPEKERFRLCFDAFESMLWGDLHDKICECGDSRQHKAELYK